jgi:hypothetical protein
MVRLAQIMHQSCTNTNIVSKWTKTHGPHHLGDPSSAPKIISEPMICSTQSVHLLCVKISSMSKHTESSFHLSLVTEEYHWMRPNWLLSLRYIRHKSCTYHALMLTVFKRTQTDSKWPTSPWSSIGCVQNNFWAYGTFCENMHLSCVKISTIFKQTKSSFHLSLIT